MKPLCNRYLKFYISLISTIRFIRNGQTDQVHFDCRMQTIPVETFLGPKPGFFINAALVYTRLAGILTFQGGVYAVYNLRDEVPSWMGEGESKVLWHMESMFYPIREEYHPYHRAAVMFGENYDVALSLLQTIRETKKLDYGLFRSFYRIRYIPMNDFGARLLRVITSDNWQMNLLFSLFGQEKATSPWGGLQFHTLIDGIDTYCFLDGDIRNLFNFRDTILMRKEGLLPSDTISGHQVICYPEQLAFVQEFFCDLAEYATVTMDAVENALELNRPSLIE